MSQRAKKPPRRPPEPAEVRIDRVGSEGDGIARLADGTPLYIPHTLPDEVVSAHPLQPRGDGWHGRADAITTRSEARVTAPCQHFSRCGGCVLQHWRDTDYRSWKSGILSFALRQAGFSSMDTPDFVTGRLGERRRIDFAVRRVAGRIILGLHGPRSSEVIDLTDCLVLHPELMALMQPLRRLLQDLKAVRRQGSILVNRLDSGPDMLLRTDGPLVLEDRTALTGFAASHGLSRISHEFAGSPGQASDGPETIGLLRPPVTTLSGVTIRLPPGAFLQATREGEHAIIEAVKRALPVKVTSKTRILELYAGCGTLTFALASLVRVVAYEGDAASVSALQQAVNQGGLAGRVEARQRDLARQPILAKEMAPFAAVVLDPPHAGANAQITQVAASGVPVVIYVSCNPATLSRDARLLNSAGYQLTALTAIDQFLWSARLESVSVFRRG